MDRIQSAKCHATWQYHPGLQEDYGEYVFFFRPVTKCAFKKRHQNVTHIRRPGRLHHSEEVSVLTTLVDSYLYHTFHDLTQETGLVHTTLLHILKNHLRMRKIVS